MPGETLCGIRLSVGDGRNIVTVSDIENPSDLQQVVEDARVLLIDAAKAKVLKGEY